MLIVNLTKEASQGVGLLGMLVGGYPSYAKVESPGQPGVAPFLTRVDCINRWRDPSMHVCIALCLLSMGAIGVALASGNPLPV